uniref:Transposase n=1 Tax=Parastrongyloides trichosuri TaxID=131310 RepID=A0A0N4Z811_PARTI
MSMAKRANEAERGKSLQRPASALPRRQLCIDARSVFGQHAKAGALDNPWIGRILGVQWVDAFTIGPTAPDDGVAALRPGAGGSFGQGAFGAEAVAQNEIGVGHGDRARCPAGGREPRVAGLMAIIADATHLRH